MTIKEAEQEAHIIDATLRADDPRFENNVVVEHEDGSYFFWRNAFMSNLDEDVVAVFTEHYGYHLFSTDEVHVREFPQA